MRMIRNWLMFMMCISLVIAVSFDWNMFCKVEVAVNALALLACITVDLFRRKQNIAGRQSQ